MKKMKMNKFKENAIGPADIPTATGPNLYSGSDRTKTRNKRTVHGRQTKKQVERTPQSGYHSGCQGAREPLLSTVDHGTHKARLLLVQFKKHNHYNILPSGIDPRQCEEGLYSFLSFGALLLLGLRVQCIVLAHHRLRVPHGHVGQVGQAGAVLAGIAPAQRARGGDLGAGAGGGGGVLKCGQDGLD